VHGITHKSNFRGRLRQHGCLPQYLTAALRRIWTSQQLSDNVGQAARCHSCRYVIRQEASAERPLTETQQQQTTACLFIHPGCQQVVAWCVGLQLTDSFFLRIHVWLKYVVCLAGFPYRLMRFISCTGFENPKVNLARTEANKKDEVIYSGLKRSQLCEQLQTVIPKVDMIY
jgi:hypothetical protein